MKLKKNSTAVIAKDSADHYLEMVTSAVESLEDALSEANKNADKARTKAFDWKSRHTDALYQQDRASSPEGRKAMVTLSNQAERFQNLSAKDYEDKIRYTKELSDNITKMERVVNELNSIKNRSVLEQKLALMDAQNNATWALTGSSVVNVESFDRDGIKRLVYEVEGLLEILH